MVDLRVTAKPRPRHEQETWVDWRPWEHIDPEQLMTRQELVIRARAAGITVTTQDIANWQRDDILPRGIRRRSGRVVEMLYPGWYVSLLRDVRAKQAEGWRLAEVGPRLRTDYAVPRPKTHATIRIDVAFVLKAEHFDSEEHARDFVRQLIHAGQGGDNRVETWVILSTETRDGR